MGEFAPPIEETCLIPAHNISAAFAEPRPSLSRLQTERRASTGLLIRTAVSQLMAALRILITTLPPQSGRPSLAEVIRDPIRRPELLLEILSSRT